MGDFIEQFKGEYQKAYCEDFSFCDTAGFSAFAYEGDGLLC